MGKYINIDDLKKKKRFDFAKQRHNVRMTDIYNAPSIEIVRCAECVYCNIQNTKYIYAICERHGIVFKPFEDDTRTHFCAWGVKADRKTENSSEIPNNCEDEPQTDDLQDWKDRMWTEAVVTEQKWICARCGCVNHVDFKWCFKCGYHKPETDQTEEPYEYEIKALHKDHIEPYVIIEDDQTERSE